MATLVEDSASLVDKHRLEGILKALHDQRTASRFCDVLLRVCGEEIFAHSNVLAAASPYFGSFLGQGQDLPRAFSQKTPQVIEIHIDGSDGDSGYGEAVRKVVDFMYTSNICLNLRILTQVLEISKIMQMEPLTNFCEHFQSGFRGHKVIPANDTSCKYSKVDVGTCTTGNSVNDIKTEVKDATVLHSETTEKSGEIKVERGMKQTKKRGRGRPRKSKKEEESDDDFSAFISLMAEEENAGKEKIGQTDIDHNNEGNNVGVEEDIDEDEGKNENDNNLSTMRTRGKRPITSYLTSTRSSARLRNSRSPRFRSDFIMHPLKRASRGVNKVIKIEKESKNCENKDVEENEDSEDRKEDDANFMPKGRNYTCDKCDFKAKRVKVLAEHKKKHLHAENICSFCDYKAESETDFKAHLVKHDGPTPYFCKFCDVKFKSRTQLNTHLPKHREDKPFVCNLCGAGFKWKHALKNHMITHSVTKDHLCDICGFATAHKSQLKAHRLIHTGETFKCDFEGCGFEATKRQNLKYHMLTHTHEKPHQCEICGHSFSLIKNMKRHMLLHSDDRPHSCEQCNFSTTRYDKLKEHMLKQHSVGDPPTKKHRISDYHEEENAVVAGADIMTQATLQTVANIAAVCADENQGETQIFSTVDGVPIVARVQYAEINSQGVIQYVAQVE
ncbi:myoneurin-like [Haliotis asinina]|uniref:myoneurin-like n=1 Tax=Haliotis asinina TaxID=109174 RepID=UPI0035318093